MTWPNIYWQYPTYILAETAFPYNICFSPCHWVYFIMPFSYYIFLPIILSISSRSHCHGFMPFFCCTLQPTHALWWEGQFLQKVWMAATEQHVDDMLLWKNKKIQIVLPCTATDRHSVAVKVKSCMVKPLNQPFTQFHMQADMSLLKWQIHLWSSVFNWIKKSEMKHTMSWTLHTCWV